MKCYKTLIIINKKKIIILLKKNNYLNTALFVTDNVCKDEDNV